MDPKRKRTLIVIPAYNEEKNIREVIERSLPFANLCVVDDGSKDRTNEIIRSFPMVICITHKVNTHIPQAILDGMRYAYDNGYDYVITMDAGLSHKPEELKMFIDAPQSDLVLGVRTHKKNVPIYRKFLSFMAKVLINFSMRPIGVDIPPASFNDVTSGFRRYSRNAFGLLLKKKLRAKSFDFHTEALMIVYRNGLSVSEVPIVYDFTGSSLTMKVVIQSIKMFLHMLSTKRDAQVPRET